MSKNIRISPKGIVFLDQDITGDQYRNKHDKIRAQVKKAKSEKVWVNFSIWGLKKVLDSLQTVHLG